jgi:hypothetical protein
LYDSFKETVSGEKRKEEKRKEQKRKGVHHREHREHREGRAK